MSIKDHLIKLTMWWQGAQKLRNDRPGGATAPPASRQFRHYLLVSEDGYGPENSTEMLAATTFWKNHLAVIA